MRRFGYLAYSVSSCVAVGILLTGCTAPAPAPVPAPDVTPISGEAAEEIMAQVLDDQWAATGLPTADRPTVTRERIIDANEWASVITGCLNEAGFSSATADEDGGIASGSLPAAQQSAYAMAMYTCNAKYPVSAVYNTPLDDSQLEYIYSYFESTLIPCLNELGYEIEEPPSRTSFVTNYGPNGWSPYKNLSLGSKKLAEAQERCPQVPEGLYG
ncbi:hypothetical protein [Agromyces larvae]|uniref:DUF732 domain-containing protein n=1 Tax=Agromyces larvae TaxID=2929802 RepID=A0ABY4BW97_9MICO|nr:hypothetical protein [Agromyces larvae]UOE43179.1 hypothetical protein MTO99_13410 [Agromyces larvae]